VIFNGIPGDLTERSDLASRTIKLEISRIVQRRIRAILSGNSRQFGLGCWAHYWMGWLGV